MLCYAVSCDNSLLVIEVEVSGADRRGLNGTLQCKRGNHIIYIKVDNICAENCVLYFVFFSSHFQWFTTQYLWETIL